MQYKKSHLKPIETHIPFGKRLHSYGTITMFNGENSLQMAIRNSYIKNHINPILKKTWITVLCGFLTSLETPCVLHGRLPHPLQPFFLLFDLLNVLTKKHVDVTFLQPLYTVIT